MNYSVLEKKLDIGKEFKGFLTQIFDEKLDCIMEAIHKRQFWCDDLSLNYLGTIEDKRKIIGATFIDVFEREAKLLDGVEWLAQGTIYPDVIESAASKFGKAHVIKSHHNVGGLPERMSLKLSLIHI